MDDPTAAASMQDGHYLTEPHALSRDYILPAGSWLSHDTARFAHLHADEVARLQAHAETYAEFREADDCTCSYPDNWPCGYHKDHDRHAPWADHHPVVREVWTRRGLSPTAPHGTEVA